MLEPRTLKSDMENIGSRDATYRDLKLQLEYSL